jgi:hypothetical protein
MGLLLQGQPGLFEVLVRVRQLLGGREEKLDHLLLVSVDDDLSPTHADRDLHLESALLAMV